MATGIFRGLMAALVGLLIAAGNTGRQRKFADARRISRLAQKRLDDA
jgi:hypothetical protein